jgi:uncharacterized membrane protein YhaH (DUF805 family)
MTDNLYKAPEAELTRKAMYLSKPRDLAICDVLFSFQGRLNRKQFWFVHGFYLLTQTIAVIDVFLFIGVFILFQWPLMASQTKRWHDIGKSGWNCLLWFVPLVGLMMTFIEAGLSKGHLIRNQYGGSLYRAD